MRHDDEHKRVIRFVICSSKLLCHFLQLVARQISPDSHFKEERPEQKLEATFVFDGSWSVQVPVLEVDVIHDDAPSSRILVHFIANLLGQS